MQLIPAGNPSAWTGPTGNNTYLLTGSVPTLIDAGVGVPAHLAAVEDGLRGAPLAAILITHRHPDHVAGLPALLERWPAARVRHARGDGFRHDEVFAAGDTTLRALHTPGHAPDHFCFLDETTRDVFCGDLARLDGTIVIPASAGGNLRLYLASLRSVRDLRARRLLPGHGPIVEDPAALLGGYLRHRKSRERQIVEALRAGSTTAAAIVSRVYGGLSPGLVRAASDSVLAHLVKLSEDGAVEQDGDAWRLADRESAAGDRD